MSAPSYLFPNKMVVKLIGYLYDELKNIKRNIIYGEDTKEMTVLIANMIKIQKQSDVSFVAEFESSAIIPSFVTLLWENSDDLEKYKYPIFKAMLSDYSLKQYQSYYSYLVQTKLRFFPDSYQYFQQ